MHHGGARAARVALRGLRRAAQQQQSHPCIKVRMQAPMLLQLSLMHSALSFPRHRWRCGPVCWLPAPTTLTGAHRRRAVQWWRHLHLACGESRQRPDHPACRAALPPNSPRPVCWTKTATPPRWPMAHWPTASGSSSLPSPTAALKAATPRCTCATPAKAWARQLMPACRWHR